MPDRFSFLTAALIFAGCGAPDLPPTETYTARGVYLGVAYDSAAAVVNHEAIPGFMDAMRMPIRVADGAVLRGLEDGDKIEFLLADTGDGYAIQRIDPLPADTPLTLADTEGPALPTATTFPDAATSDTTEAR